MKLMIAKTAGFCFGVERAFSLAQKLADEYGSDVCTYGPIIHNKDAVSELAKKGVDAVNTLEEINGRRLIIRAHGVGKHIIQALEEKNIVYYDATCPYVKKIHYIVEESYKKGEQIIIIGDASHPEVIGINGWAHESAYILDNVEALKEFDKNISYTVVSQTTFNRKVFQEIENFLKNHFTSVKIFDTICSATNNRQIECAEISKQVDGMIVIGGSHSSNTIKLYQIAKANCADTYHIENVSQLPWDKLKGKKSIGITAGASTPALIIKEVIDKMSEESTKEVKETAAEESFAEAFEKTFVTLNTGDIVTGTVIGITPTEVFVNLGYKMDGYIPVSELCDDPDVKPESIVSVGDEIEVFIVRVNDVEGTVQLSKKKIDAIKGWKFVEEAFENKEIISGKVIEIVKGGMIVLYQGTRIFVPASQSSDRYLSDLSVLLNKEVKLRIIDIKPRRRVVGSVKSVLLEEKERLSAELWANIEVGKELKGVVKSITSFGAFVDVGGVDGLVHISELSWSKIKHPSEVLNVGDVVDVYVIDFDKEKNKVSLGYKKQSENPWVLAKDKYHKDDVVSCTIVRLVPFGAFAELEKGLDGLIHISQISTKRIAKPSDELQIGQQVEAKILEIDFEKQKISLSIRALKEEVGGETETPSDPEIPTEHTEELNATIGDTIKAEVAAEEAQQE